MIIKVFTYRFADWEMKTIADGLKSEVKKRKIKIEEIRNHPKNEGQFTYSIQIDDLKDEVERLEKTIEEFSANEPQF